MSSWLWFTVGCCASACVGYGVSAKVWRSWVKYSVEDLELDQQLLKQKVNLLVHQHNDTMDELDAAHHYFDQLRIPREIGNKQLSLVDRIGLVKESMPPTMAVWGGS